MAHYFARRSSLASVPFLACLSILLMLTPKTAQAATGALTLANNGKTRYVIAVADDAIPAEKTAATQLQKYLQQITGATFAVQSEKEVSADAPQILIGPGTRAKNLLPKQDWASLGTEGIIIKTAGNDLILVGGRPRGTLYAVFEFLEKIGCRFWTPTEFDIPHKPSLDIPAQDVVYVPPFTRREHHATEILEHPEFATIMRENGTYLKQTKAWGGRFVQLRCSFNDLLPIEKYFKDHPEWYTDALNHDLPCASSSKMPANKKVWQLDTTNPQAVEEAARRAIQKIKRRPNADSIALWFQDNPHYCKSPRAMAIIKKHGSPSALMLKYVNEVAAKIHQVYPKIQVEMQAYWWTVKPPKDMTAGPNVVIEVAPLGSDFGHPFNSPWNKNSLDRLLGWAKISPKLNLYYYCANFRFSMFPHPNWFTFGPDFRFWADHHVVNLYNQGNGGTGDMGDFMQLRTWLMAKLMWNPKLDQNQLMDEFLDGYYGPAGPYLRRYIELIQTSYDSKHSTPGTYLGTYNADFTFMTFDVVNQGYKLFEEAARAVKDNPTFSARVRGERLSLDVVALAKFNYFQNQAKATGKPFLGPNDLDQAMVGFRKAAIQFGVKRLFSDPGHDTLDTGLAYIRRRLEIRPTVALPAFAQGYGPGQVVDFQPDEIHLYAKGTLTSVMNDPAAAGGKASTSRGNTSEQTIQIRIGPFLPFHRWHVYVYARADVQPGTTRKGVAFKGGIKDLNTGKMTYTRPFPLEQAAGKTYHLFDLGTHELDGGKEIRFNPLNKPDITRIYISRVILVHEGAKKISIGE